MKRISFWFLSTLSVVVLLFSYKTSLSPTARNSTVAASRPVVSSPATTVTSGSGRTVTGSAVDTRYGPVQVQIAVASGKITSVSVVQYPSGNGRDAAINSYAIPQLVSETMSAQSAQIDMVSGATYTSNGYVTSLQSALDQAGI